MLTMFTLVKNRPVLAAGECVLQSVSKDNMWSYLTISPVLFYVILCFQYAFHCTPSESFTRFLVWKRKSVLYDQLLHNLIFSEYEVIHIQLKNIGTYRNV